MLKPRNRTVVIFVYNTDGLQYLVFKALNVFRGLELMLFVVSSGEKNPFRSRSEFQPCHVPRLDLRCHIVIRDPYKFKRGVVISDLPEQFFDLFKYFAFLFRAYKIALLSVMCKLYHKNHLQSHYIIFFTKLQKKLLHYCEGHDIKILVTIPKIINF